ncbi:hypothetical protein [Micromonospora robiginosa]|uniref:Uncharacterized protein n=1 Tax=Micromonospora robiginosa TaxID=2749844 RepID=A0AAF0P2Q8_9ACTN|nr:hypothetical protein [Micromonospora ferruginea]WMF04619.1 hypothetical protein H1D33_05605 [Micromonospora ferruginea]
MATLVALVTLAAWRPAGILSVVLALVCVVLGMIAGVTVTSARQSGGAEPPRAEDWPASDPSFGVDADTLQAIDPRAVRNLRAPGGHPIDADTLETLDPRSVRQQQRAGNGLSDR